MNINTNKERGNAGLALAIAYYGSNGYTVSIPLNDTQDYDIIADKDSLERVQAKFSTQKSRHGKSRIPLRSLGGTKGIVYKTVRDTEIDTLFFSNPEGQMWKIPKEAITQTNVLSLGKRYDQYRVSL